MTSGRVTHWLGGGQSPWGWSTEGVGYDSYSISEHAESDDWVRLSSDTGSERPTTGSVRLLGSRAAQCNARKRREYIDQMLQMQLTDTRQHIPHTAAGAATRQMGGVFERAVRVYERAEERKRRLAIMQPRCGVAKTNTSGNKNRIIC